MKIALVAENENEISQHFGRAPFYMVVNVEDGKITEKEMRARAGHNTCACGEGHHSPENSGHTEGHGFDADSRHKHASMAGAIADCQVLIAGGMGMGAYESLESCNIKPMITDVKNPEEAVKLYLEDKLINLMGRLH